MARVTLPSPSTRTLAVAMLVLAAGLLVTQPRSAHADARAFTFSYEVQTMPKGVWEYEQWVTWKTSKSVDSDFDQFDFRHEFETGLTDRWQAAVYVSDWRYVDGDSVSDDGAEWRNIAFETIYQLTDPVEDPVGVGLYGEVKVGDELAELEGKLLLQKNVGRWVFVWNGIFEAEWEGDDFHEDKGELGQTFGISYQFSPAWRAGAELIHEIEYEDWSEWGDHVVYAGPNLSYATKKWWVTVTPTFQLTDIDTEADFQTRLIFGIFF